MYTRVYICTVHKVQATRKRYFPDRSSLFLDEHNENECAMAVVWDCARFGSQ